MKKRSKKANHKNNAKKAAVKRRIKKAAANAGRKYTGVFSSSGSGYGFVTPDGENQGNDVFIPAKSVGGAVHGDRVAFTKTGGARGEEGRIVSVLSRAVTEFTGILRRFSRPDRPFAVRNAVIADDKKLCFDIFISEKDVCGAQDGDKVLCGILKYPDVSASEPAYAKIIKVYGAADSLAANTEADIDKYKIRTQFPPEAAEEAKTVSKSPVSRRGRLDLTDECIFTIDGAYAKDLDDAISVTRNKDGYLLGVHIADVSSYVKTGSALDGEAFLRTSSIYYADKVIPMLPVELSNGCCSLNPGVNRRTLSAFVSVDFDGNITGCEIKESVIRSKVRGVYSEVNDIIRAHTEGGAERSVFYEKYACVLDNGALDDILSLYRTLEEKAKRRGVPELDSPEPCFIIENGDVSDVFAAERGVAERIIEQFMTAANEGVAGALTAAGLPCVYRVHGEPDGEKIARFSAFVSQLGIDASTLGKAKIKQRDLSPVLAQAEEKGVGGIVSYALLRSMMKAEYNAVPSPHFGIGARLYCHFTSPIRRYPDLCVHRTVKTLLLHDHTKKALADGSRFCAEAAERCSAGEKTVLAFERGAEDLYKADYMRKRIGEEYDGMISSVVSGGVFVRLDNTCEGFLPFYGASYVECSEDGFSAKADGRLYRIGDRIRIRVVSVNLCAKRVDFEEICEKSKKIR